MPFWNTQRLKGAIPAQGIVDTFQEDRVKNCAYELSVGYQYYSTDLKNGLATVAEREQIIIRPGQLALLVTLERVKIPIGAIGFISMKFSAKMRGLINVSGFHVDPGFSGHLKFAVYNAGSKPAVFDPGSPLFQLWLADLSDAAEPYNGTHGKDDNRINDKDVMDLQGDVASPAQLHAQIDAISGATKTQMDAIRTAIETQVAGFRGELTKVEWIFGLLFTALIGVLLADLLQGKPQSPVNVYNGQTAAPMTDAKLNTDLLPDAPKQSDARTPAKDAATDQKGNKSGD